MKNNIIKLKYKFIWIIIIIIFFFIICIYNKNVIKRIEYLTNSPYCKNFDCSEIQRKDGITYKNCLAGDPTCKENQPCSICTKDSTNISCINNNNCVGDNEDPYGQQNHLGHDVGCCPGTAKFLNTWDNDGRNYYKCCKTNNNHTNIHNNDQGIPCTTDVDCADHGGKCSDGQCINFIPISPPKQGCETNNDCGSGMICQGGQCVYSGGGGGNSPDIKTQPNNSVQIINNTSENPLHVYLQSLIGSGGNPTVWNKIGGQGQVAPPVKYAPDGSQPANDVGAGWWCVVTLAPKEWILLHIPDDMPPEVAWSIRPLKYRNGRPCDGAPGDCGMPILIESGKEMVGDMSAVDGVNFLNKYEMTGKNGIKVIDFNKNPCRAIMEAGENVNPKGCRNPSVDGIYNTTDPSGENYIPIDKCINDNQPGKGLFHNPNVGPHCWGNDPCPAGTCNLVGISKVWCDTIHHGQCASSSTNWKGLDTSPACQQKNSNTTYCFSHDDANSSPMFSYPYKIKITYSDLL